MATTRDHTRAATTAPTRADVAELLDRVARLRCIQPHFDRLEQACWRLRELGVSWSDITREFESVAARLQRDEAAS